MHAVSIVTFTCVSAVQLRSQSPAACYCTGSSKVPSDWSGAQLSVSQNQVSANSIALGQCNTQRAITNTPMTA